jgi:hypothetical protein
MTKSSMSVNTDHELSPLIGKKIKSISLQEVDIHKNGENVRQFYVIGCTDGEKFVLAVDGGNTQQYATAELLEVDEFSDFLESVECEDSLDDDDEFDSSDDDDDHSGLYSDNLFDESEVDD